MIKTRRCCYRITYVLSMRLADERAFDIATSSFRIVRSVNGIFAGRLEFSGKLSVEFWKWLNPFSCLQSWLLLTDKRRCQCEIWRRSMDGHEYALHQFERAITLAKMLADGNVHACEPPIADASKKYQQKQAANVRQHFVQFHNE